MRKLVIYISAFLLLAACSNQQPAAESDQGKIEQTDIVTLDSTQMAGTKLSTVEVKKKTLSGTFKVNGIIDVPPQNMVSVSMPLGGYLKSTKLLPGMHFNKGEVIATMEDPKYIELQQDYLISRSTLELHKSEYERQKLLNESKASSDKVFQQAKAAYESAVITHRSLSEKLALIGLNANKLSESSLSRSIPIYAPISGFVSKVNVNIGKYVNPTDVLFELVNPEDIHLSLNIFEKDMENLYMGQKVIAYTNNHPEKKYPCEIILIGKDIGSDRSVNVHCHFEKYDKSLVPGTYMNAQVFSAGKEALVVPEEAIIEDGKNQFIFIEKTAGTYQMIKVKTGLTEGSEIEITDSDGHDLSKQKVVTHGAYSLWMKRNNSGEE